jgi:hypothetical protein
MGHRQLNDDASIEGPEDTVNPKSRIKCGFGPFRESWSGNRWPSLYNLLLIAE